MMCSVNHQNILKDEEDNWQFINTLDRMRIRYGEYGTSIDSSSHLHHTG
jgi:hypothetical protein